MTLSRGLFAYLPSRPAFRLSATWGFAALQLGLLGQSRISPLLSDFFYFVLGFVTSLSWFALDSPSGFTYALVGHFGIREMLFVRFLLDIV